MWEKLIDEKVRHATFLFARVCMQACAVHTRGRYSAGASCTAHLCPAPVLQSSRHHSVTHNKLLLQLASVPPAKAQEMVDSGKWLIVDVRPKKDFEKSTIEGAANAPLFQSMSFQNATPKSLLRAVAFALNGVAPVEPNGEFDEEVKAACGGKGAILVRTLRVVVDVTIHSIWYVWSSSKQTWVGQICVV